MTLARESTGPGDSVRPVAPGNSAGIEYVKVGTPVAGCEIRIANREGGAEPGVSWDES